ncbi:MAG TPA: hypothetical protein VF846_19590, partial [Thermoanaerobaculia bacterium]
PGEVLDITSLTDKAEIKFPSGVYSMTAILREDNTWSVMPTSAANKRIIERRAQREAQRILGGTSSNRLD